jgi:hypothetical protein
MLKLLRKIGAVIENAQIIQSKYTIVHTQLSHRFSLSSPARWEAERSIDGIDQLPLIR